MGRRRFGSIRKTASGRWQARYKGPDGRPRIGPATFSTKTDAARYLDRVGSDIDRGIWLDPVGGDVRLSAYATAWLTERTVKGRPLAPRTRDTYSRSLRLHIEPVLGQHPLSRLTPAVVRTWHADLSQRTGPTATRQAYALLKAVLSTAVQDEALHRNPCTIRGAGQPSTSNRPPLSLEDVDKLTDAMPERYRSLVTVSFWAHLRLGEIVGLRRGDIDLKAGTLRVANQVVETTSGPLESEPKWSSIRTVHLPDQAVQVLAEHLAALPGLPTAKVWTRPNGQPLRGHHVHSAWKAARERVGLPGARLHDLRHAGLTLTAQTGATTAEVMARAGHSTQRAAMQYQHAAAERDQLVARRLSEVQSVPLNSAASGTRAAQGPVSGR